VLPAACTLGGAGGSGRVAPGYEFRCVAGAEKLKGGRVARCRGGGGDGRGGIAPTDDRSDEPWAVVAPGRSGRRRRRRGARALAATARRGVVWRVNLCARGYE
jgi:hypothetical protein